MGMQHLPEHEAAKSRAVMQEAEEADEAPANTPAGTLRSRPLRVDQEQEVCENVTMTTARARSCCCRTPETMQEAKEAIVALADVPADTCFSQDLEPLQSRCGAGGAW